MMALDGKTIKEEVPEKESYDSCNLRKSKGKERCNTPDSPEGARIIAPRSPAAISPHHVHPNTVPTPNRSSSVDRRGSSSPTASPPPTITPTAALLANSVTDNQKLSKIRRFLGALVQFGQDTSGEIGDRLRSLVLSLASGGLTIEEFQIAVQDAANFPLRPNAVSFLRSHLPCLQREINNVARINKQSPNQYVRTNENTAFEMHHNLTEAHADIFLSNETGISLKRRAPETLLYESHLANSNLSHEWSDYISPAKRPHHSLAMLSSSALPHLINHPSLFEYQNGIHSHQEQMHNATSREDRDIRSESVSNRSSRLSMANTTVTANQVNGSGILSGDEEWKNIHTMLSCISGMVEKTKKAISILQHRGSDSTAGQISHHEVSIISDIRRQTEEKIAEFRRSAEDAVNQVKRQAVLEIQRSVAAAETRAIEAIAQERLKMEKMFGDMNRSNEGDSNNDPQTPGSNSCWNCGRKANETCGGCSVARYCGSYCQHKDWEQHHQACGTIASRSTESHSANIIKTSVAISQHTRSNTNSSNSSSSRSSPTNNQISNAATTNGNIANK